MRVNSLLFQTLAIASVMFAAPLAAHAADAKAVAERLKGVLAGQGVELSFSGVSGDASHVVLDGTTAKLASGDRAVTVGTVTLDDVSDVDGGYRVGKVTLPTYSIMEDGLAIEVASATLTGLKLPAEGATDPLALIIQYEAADLATVNVKQGDKQIFTMNDLHVQLTPPQDGKALQFTGNAGKFSADLSSVGDPATKKVLEALGYQALSGTFQMAGSWQPTDGRLGLTQYDVAIDNAGKIGLTFDLGGYTADFMKALQAMQRQMAAQPEGADNSAQGLAMLGLLQQLTFHGATIRFDDASLTGKVIDYVAAQQGAKPADVVNQVKAILPFMLAQLNNPELMKNVSEAVGKFLDAPKSLEIKAQPAAPVPFALVAAGAMASPQDLPKTLGVSVIANE